MNKKAFTVMEVTIAAAILITFIGGLLTLFSSGNKMGNSAMWLQTISNQLKNTARQINTSIRKSSYPSKLIFPQGIEVCDNDCFKLRYCKKVLNATETLDINSPNFGTVFLKLTEATPAKSGLDTKENHDAKLTYHIFSLAKNGNLTYSRYEETVKSDDISKSLTKTVPGSAPKIFTTLLTRDVESVHCTETSSSSSDRQHSLKITVNCKSSRGNTRRSEVAVGTPNVEMIGDL